ncbi:VOC family protein [Brevirhabdus sp.]|uniref:VOC family protein n=1 Tax=Brevirhabdus sp. TaxID=2004514 RepID=UPI004058CECD
MKIHVTSVFVDDQAKAQRFYTEILGFTVKHDIPLDEHRWLTVVSADDPEGAELLLEPGGHPAVGPYRKAIFADGIAAHSFQVQDLDAEWMKLTGRGVMFVTEPMDAGSVHRAVFDDTCGNLIQLIQMKEG